MDLPQPPSDIELKNIIDKLAQFVARNGPEFEQMTKNKQKDNPKFSFLFGGELFNYYQYKVTTEQAILKLKAAKSASQVPGPPLPPAGVGLPIESYSSQGSNLVQSNAMTPMQIMAAAAGNSNAWMMPQHAPVPNNGLAPHTSIIEQQNVLQQQITLSEQNLAAQHSALLEAQESLIDEAVRKAINESISQRAEEHNVNLLELNNVLQPIVDSCTKDSISSGKAWILSHTSPGAHEVIAQHLLQKVVSPGVQFTQKLHIIYLINDVMHHCVRKNADDLKKSLQEVVVPMYCNSWIGSMVDQQTKLSKLLNLWEAKNNYFSKDIIAKLKTPEKSWLEYQRDLLESNENVTGALKLSTKTSFENFRAQHQLFVNHALTQIQTLETQKMQLEQQEVQNQMQMQLQSIQVPPSMQNDGGMSFEGPPPGVMAPQMESVPFNQPPPPLFEHLPPELLPDFSRPPPGFQGVEPLQDDLVPSVPYYELPAGLMVPLIKQDDFNYKPLDPGKLRLPPAIPPSERLMQAVEAFYQKSYAGNTRDRLILDADGWEKLGLYEYYKAKNAAKKKKELEIEAGFRQKSKSPSPVIRERSRSRSPKKKRYRSKSPTPEKARSRSRSRSPPPPPRHSSSSRRGSNRSPRRSAPARSRRSRTRSRSRSPSPSRARSPTPPPPSFGGGGFGRIMEEKLDESNKGHQMLRKMGWGGAGLGSNEQGIEDPISGGDVRDRVDQYKGVGVSLHDPYENFRKSKGQSFIARMKARAEERAGTT